MKHRLIILILLLFLLIPGAAVRAQAVPAIDTLSADLWPDYDQEAVLVLLTGTLSQPGTVSLPIPADADFHVLARIDDDGVMIDDLGDPAIVNGQMTFTTPDQRFRVEYYMPYTSSGNQRSFNYTWLADIPVNQLLVSVQQPAAAVEMIIDPQPVGEVQNQDDGLLYYNLPAQRVPAGQPATFQVNYTMTSDTLTVASNPPPVSGGGAPAAVGGASEGTPAWVLGLVGAGLLLIVMAITWQIATNNNSRTRKPKPRRAPVRKKPAPARKGRKRPSAPSRSARFCHECGQQAAPGDRFCRSCGTTLKR